MKNLIRGAIVGLCVILGGFTVASLPAQAAPAPASVTAQASPVTLADVFHQGGSGNFYKTGSCSTPWGTAKITNYDSDNYTTQTYHHGLTPKAGYYVNGVRYNGSIWPLSSGSSGTKKDGYQKFADETADVLVTAVFSNAQGQLYSCQMRAY